MKTYVNKGISYSVGCNAEENWKLIGLADKEEYWVHLKGYTSAHVIIHIDKVLPDDIEYAHELILNHTKKAPRAAEVIYSKVKNIKKGSKVGEVIIIKYEK